ncbi:HAD family hydrolase [Nocardia arizonensis]|uniref:HAD family hydrolase n=1 Tax=Nocardia arizonensis TaxID=1141647 RepID=UPI000B2A5A38|nr:HAD hydrolase-like protein [Nocardia arizonensis]
MNFTVGFDLDMTLIDTRPGVARLITMAAAEFGIHLDEDEVAMRLGPRTAELLAESGAPAEVIPTLVARYRALYPSIIAEVAPMAGAAAALEAVRRRGGQVVVVTGKHQPHAQLHIDTLGWKIDRLVGGLWSTNKAEALRTHGVSIFVGDHAGDMVGARAAEVIAVGVVTGPCDAGQLWDAGADVVLADLLEFPRWLAIAGPRRVDHAQHQYRHSR